MKAKQSTASLPNFSLSNFTQLWAHDAVNLVQEDRKLGLGAEIGVCDKFVWVKFGESVMGF